MFVARLQRPRLRAASHQHVASDFDRATSMLPSRSKLRSKRFQLRTGVMLLSAAGPLFGLFAITAPAVAQDRPFWEQDNQPSARSAPPSRVRREDAYKAPETDGPAGGFGQQADVTGRPYDGQPYGAQPYGGPQPAPQGYGSPSYSSQGYGAPGYGQGNAPPPGYGSPETSNQGYGQPQYGAQGNGAPGYGAPGNTAPGYGAPGYGQQGDSYGGRPAQAQRGNDAYQPPRQAGGYDGGSNDAYRPGGPPAYSPGYSEPSSGYGQPYGPPPDQYASPGPGAGPGAGPGYGDDYRRDDRRGGGSYSQNEVIDTGHRFFGSVSQGIAQAVESIFKRQGRPNGYILGEDAGGAFVAGLRYGEGVLSTKDAGTHRVFWQGPSLGYDFGGEGSKTMVLVYNLRDPSDIYERYGGVQGSAYLVGGVSVQFQAREGVTLAVIRSGVGLRLGANVGYLKYTRRPTWNPF